MFPQAGSTVDCLASVAHFISVPCWALALWLQSRISLAIVSGLVDAHLVLQSPARLEHRQSPGLSNCLPSFSAPFPLVLGPSTSFLSRVVPRFSPRTSRCPSLAFLQVLLGGWIPVVQYMSGATVTHEVPVSKFIPKSPHALICVALQYTWTAARNSGAHLRP